MAGRFRFTDHTAVKRDVQIPANAFYTPTGLATAITTLTSCLNVMCTDNATTQFFTFVDRNPLQYLQFYILTHV